MPLPSIAVWDATASCPMKCEFCFGPTAADSPSDLSTSQAKSLVDALSSKGVKTLVFSGGDPLCRSDILGLVSHAHSLGLKTVLHTSGLLVTDSFLSSASGILDRINLPLDGDEATNSLMRRNPEHFSIVAGLLNKLSQQDRIKTSVTTVLSSINVHCVEFLASFLQQFKVEKWFVYQFRSGRGRSLQNADSFLLSAEEFSAAESRARAVLEGASFPKKVLFKPAIHDSFDDSYFLVSNTGEISFSHDTVFAGQVP